MKRRESNKRMREVERALAPEMRAYIANIEEFGAAECPHLEMELENLLTYRCRLDKELSDCWVDGLYELGLQILAPDTLSVVGRFWLAVTPRGPQYLVPFEGAFRVRGAARRPLDYELELGDGVPYDEVAFDDDDDE
jgi:hypothetical protein